MSGAAGIFAQFMFGEETTWGTPVVPDRAVEFVSENIKAEHNRITSNALRARRVRHSDQWVEGGKRVAGGVTLEVRDAGFGLLFKHALGSVATAGAGPYTHTFTPGDLPEGLTVQVGRPFRGGTVQPFTYAGCKIDEWTLSAAVGEVLQLELTLVGEDEDTATALETPAYPTGDLLSFIHGTITIGGTTVPLKEFELTGSNNLRGEEWRMRGSETIIEPDEGGGHRDYEGNILADFDDLTLYNRFVNGTEAAIVATFADASGTHSLEITVNARFDGETPEVSGPEALEQPQPFVCLASGAADSTALSMVYTTADVTP